MGGGTAAADWAVVEARLRRLDRAALSALVADLWDARGWETQRDGNVVTASRGTERVVLRVGCSTGGVPPARVDTLVDVAGGTHEGMTVVDASDLVERLRYAVEPAETRAICERHLGTPPAELTPPATVRIHRALPGTAVGVAAVVVGLVVALAVGVAMLPGLDSSGATGSSAGTPGPSDRPAVVSQPSTPAPQTSDQESSEAGPPVNESRLPPGVTTTGVTDIEALSGAHRSVLANRSYTIRVNRTRMELRGRELTPVTRAVTIRIDGDEYRARSVELVDGQRRLLATLYYDGSTAYRRTAEETPYLGAPGETPSYARVDSTALLRAFPQSPGTLTDRLVRTRLANATTNVTGVLEREGTRLSVLSARRDPEPIGESQVTRFESTLLVGSDGFVRVSRSDYTYLSGDVLVEEHRELVYDRVGETTVEAPAWYRERFASESQ